MTSITLYHKDASGKKEVIKYSQVTGIKAGSAAEVLGPEDARGNGIPLHAPLLQIWFDDGNTATFDAENVTILF